MANMFLQQENLIKQQWLAVLFAAVVMDRTLCHGDNDRSACEMMCGFIPNMAHVQILCGQTVMFPCDPKILDPPFEVGVHICPILASNGDHLVFVGKAKCSQVRSGLQPVD
jgi:hypothetical protein